MTLILRNRYTTAQLIKHQKLMISKLSKKHGRILGRIQSAEARLKTLKTLKAQLWDVSDELVIYNIGLERLMIAKHSSQGVQKARRAKK